MEKNQFNIVSTFLKKGKDNKSRAYYSIKCSNCDNIYDMRSDGFKNKKTLLCVACANIENAKKRNLIYKSGPVAIGFLDQYFNNFINNEFKDGTGIVLCVSSFGIVRVRINDTFNLSTESKDTLRLLICGTRDIGHTNAFTYKVQKAGFDNIMESIQNTVGIINKVIKEER